MAAATGLLVRQGRLLLLLSVCIVIVGLEQATEGAAGCVVVVLGGGGVVAVGGGGGLTPCKQHTEREERQARGAVVHQRWGSGRGGLRREKAAPGGRRFCCWRVLLLCWCLVQVGRGGIMMSPNATKSCHAMRAVCESVPLGHVRARQRAAQNQGHSTQAAEVRQAVPSSGGESLLLLSRLSTKIRSPRPLLGRSDADAAPVTATSKMPPPPPPPAHARTHQRTTGKQSMGLNKRGSKAKLLLRGRKGHP